MDASTGVMIAAAKPDRRVEPASLSKLMTAYLVFRGIDSGAFRLDEEVVVSENAWRSIGSRMFIEPGDRVSIENLIKGLNERKTETRRKCCVIIDNMCKLIEHPKEILPFYVSLKRNLDILYFIDNSIQLIVPIILLLTPNLGFCSKIGTCLKAAA